MIVMYHLDVPLINNLGSPIYNCCASTNPWHSQTIPVCNTATEDDEWTALVLKRALVCMLLLLCAWLSVAMWDDVSMVMVTVWNQSWTILPTRWQPTPAKLLHGASPFPLSWFTSKHLTDHSTGLPFLKLCPLQCFTWSSSALLAGKHHDRGGP